MVQDRNRSSWDTAFILNGGDAVQPVRRFWPCLVIYSGHTSCTVQSP